MSFPLSAAMLAHIRNASAHPNYIGASGLVDRIEWRDSGFNQVTAFEIGATDEDGAPLKMVFGSVGRFSPTGTYMAADQYYKEPGQWNIEFAKIKAKGVLVAGLQDQLRVLHQPQLDGAKAILSSPGLRTGEFSLPAGSRLGSSFVTGEGMQFRRTLFVGAKADDEDRTARAQAQEEENVSLGPEFTTPNLPCRYEGGKKALQALVEGGEHAFVPIPAFVADYSHPLLRENSADGERTAGSAATQDDVEAGDTVPTLNLVRPTVYDRTLRGAVVDVRFTITRQFIRSTKTYMFLADIEKVYVLAQAPQDVAPKKKRAYTGNDFFRDSKRAKTS